MCGWSYRYPSALTTVQRGLERARNPDATTNLGSYAAVGDELFGTALVAATFLSMLSSVKGNRVPALDMTVDPTLMDEARVPQANVPADA